MSHQCELLPLYPHTSRVLHPVSETIVPRPFCTEKETIDQMSRKPAECKRILASTTYGRGSINRIYTELKPQSEKDKGTTQKWTGNRELSKEEKNYKDCLKCSMSFRTQFRAAWICVSLVKTLIIAPMFLTMLMCRCSEPHTYDMKLKREMCCYKHTERHLMLPARGGDKERRHGSEDLTMQISSLGWRPSGLSLPGQVSIPPSWDTNTSIWMRALGEPHSFVLTSIEDASPAPKELDWFPHSQSLFLQKIKIK